MDAVLTPADYPFSRDYERLAALSCHASIVCFVDYHFRGAGVVRDVARTLYRFLDGQDRFEVGARGIGYIQASTIDEFVQRCKAVNLDFIDPPGRLGSAQ